MSITDIIVNENDELNLNDEAINTLNIFMLGMGLPIDRVDIEEIDYWLFYNCVNHLYWTQISPLSKEVFEEYYEINSDLVFESWLNKYCDNIEENDCWNWLEVIQDVLFTNLFSDKWFELAKAIGKPEFCLVYNWYTIGKVEDEVIDDISKNLETFDYTTLLDVHNKYKEQAKVCLPFYATLCFNGEHCIVKLNNNTCKLVNNINLIEK